MKGNATTVALVGGGRWGRVHAGNLIRFLSPQDRLLWISQHNHDGLRSYMAGLSWPNSPVVDIFNSLEAVLVEKPDAAIVVTAPENHFQTAKALLEKRIHTFVEKPLALSVVEADSLIRTAQHRDCILGVGLHLLSASYLDNFKKHMAGREIVAIAIDWLDPEFEVRHGEIKRGDVSTPLAHDVYPHVWSIVHVLTGSRQIIGGVKLVDRLISLELTAGDIPVTVNLGRYAEARKRKLEVHLRDGGRASLDFTAEPGKSVLDGVVHEASSACDEGPTPLVAEIQTFLEQAKSSCRDNAWPHFAASCIGSVVGAEALAEKIVAAESTALLQLLQRSRATEDNAKARKLLMSLLAPEMAARGMRIQDFTVEQRQDVVEEAFQFLDERIARESEVAIPDRDTLIGVISDFVQHKR